MPVRLVDVRERPTHAGPREAAQYMRIAGDIPGIIEIDERVAANLRIDREDHSKQDRDDEKLSGR